MESDAPGELLSAGTCGSYAFGFLDVAKQPEAAVAVQHNDMLPFYRKLGLSVKAVLTDNSREFWGPGKHPCKLYLALGDTRHRHTRIRSPETNGFVERFNRTVLDRFIRGKVREIFYDTQTDLDA